MLLNRYGLTKEIDLFAILSIVVPFTVYLLTLAPSVTFFDSGEFITAIYSLGSPHSPGYPLFVLFAKPFTWLPFGNIAFRVNIATALSAAIACYGVYLLTNFMLNSEKQDEGESEPKFLKKSAALCAALTFAFSARLWLQSNHDKPYPLLSFLSAMIFYLVLVWRRDYREGDECPGYIYLGAFFCGLSFGAHQSIVLLVPSYAWLVLSADWSLVKRIKEQIVSIAFFILGFSVYLYLPIRATRNPLLNWGDPKTLTQFLWHFLRKGYPAEQVNRDLGLLWKQLSAFNLAHEFTVVGVALLLTGLLAFAVKKRDEVIAYGMAIGIFFAVLIGYQNTPEEMIFLTEEFFTPVYLLSSVFIGMGIIFLVNKAMSGLDAGMRGSFPVRIVVGVMLLALPLTLCLTNFHENDQRENYIAYDYALNSFRSLDQDAILFTWGDSGAFPLWYLQGVEKMREDLVLLHIPHLVFPWYLDSFPDLLRTTALRSLTPELQSPDNVLSIAISEQIDRRPVFIDFSTKYSIKLDSYRLMQKGICYSVNKITEKTGKTLESSIWSLYNGRGLTGDKIPFRDLDTGKAILIYAISHLDAGKALLSAGKRDEGNSELNMAKLLAPELAEQVSKIENRHGK